MLSICPGTKMGRGSADTSQADGSRGEAVKKANLDAVKARFLAEKAQPFVPLHAVT